MDFTSSIYLPLKELMSCYMEQNQSPVFRQKVYGPVIEDSCDACGKDSVWLLTKVVKEVSFFSTIRFNRDSSYSMYCMVCGYQLALHKSLFEKLIPIAQKNASLRNKEILKK